MIDNFKPIIGNIVGNYKYIEGEKEERFFADSQTCEYYTYINPHNEKNWWILWPYIPKEDTCITKDNIVWFVDDSNIEEDINLMWDFKNHCVIYD